MRTLVRHAEADRFETVFVGDRLSGLRRRKRAAHRGKRGGRPGAVYSRVAFAGMGIPVARSMTFRILLPRSPAMRIPVIRGVIDRRILVNYHVDPNVLAALLPAPFRPKVIHGARHGRDLPDPAQERQARFPPGVAGHFVRERRSSNGRRVGRPRRGS